MVAFLLQDLANIDVAGRTLSFEMTGPASGVYYLDLDSVSVCQRLDQIIG